MESREAFVALNMVEHVGPVRVRHLLEYFGDAAAILRANKRELMQVHAHQGALSAKGRTLAILGTGIKTTLPVPRTTANT